MEAINSNPNISSMKITNEFACAPTQIDKACVVIEVKKDGLGDNLAEIKNNAREIADKIWYGQKGEYLGAIIFTPEFYSLNFSNQKVVLVWMRHRKIR